MSNENRTPEGTPAGGQFAPTTHPEPVLKLGPAPVRAEVTSQQMIADPAVLNAACGRHGVGQDRTPDDLPGDVCHLLSPLIGRMRMDAFADPRTIERLQVALALAKLAAEADYEARGGYTTSTEPVTQYGVQIGAGDQARVLTSPVTKERAEEIVGSDPDGNWRIATRVVGPWGPV